VKIKPGWGDEDLIEIKKDEAKPGDAKIESKNDVSPEGWGDEVDDWDTIDGKKESTEVGKKELSSSKDGKTSVEQNRTAVTTSAGGRGRGRKERPQKAKAEKPKVEKASTPISFDDF